MQNPKVCRVSGCKLYLRNCSAVVPVQKQPYLYKRLIGVRVALHCGSPEDGH